MPSIIGLENRIETDAAGSTPIAPPDGETDRRADDASAFGSLLPRSHASRATRASRAVTPKRRRVRILGIIGASS